MGQMIQFLSSYGASCNTQRAVAPVVHQVNKTIAIGVGVAYTDLLAAIPTGSCAADSGQIINEGCYDIKAKVTYLDGADCDSCTVDTLTTVEVEVIIPKNSSFPLPPGFITRIQVETVDSTGTPIANTTTQSVKYYGAYAPSCNGCVLVP